MPTLLTSAHRTGEVGLATLTWIIPPGLNGSRKRKTRSSPIQNTNSQPTKICIVADAARQLDLDNCALRKRSTREFLRISLG